MAPQAFADGTGVFYLAKVSGSSDTIQTLNFADNAQTRSARRRHRVGDAPGARARREKFRGQHSGAGQMESVAERSQGQSANSDRS